MSKKIIKASRKVARDTMEEKKRFHLYKSGKLWLVAGMATLSFATAELNAQVVVHADVTTSSAAATSSSAPSKQATSLKLSSTTASSSTAASTSTSSSTSSSVASTSSSSSEAASSSSSSAASASSSSASSSASSKAAPSSSAAKKQANKAKTSKNDDKDLNTKFNLGNVATVKQNGNELVFTMAQNRSLTQAQYEAILDYATRNHLSVKGLPKQTNASHKTAAAEGDNIIGDFVDAQTLEAGAGHDGDKITIDEATKEMTIELTGRHFLSKNESEKISQFALDNDYAIVDNNNRIIDSIIYNDGSVWYRESEEPRPTASDRGGARLLEYQTSDSAQLMWALEYSKRNGIFVDQRTSIGQQIKDILTNITNIAIGGGYLLGQATDGHVTEGLFYTHAYENANQNAENINKPSAAIDAVGIVFGRDMDSTGAFPHTGNLTAQFQMTFVDENGQSKIMFDTKNDVDQYANTGTKFYSVLTDDQIKEIMRSQAYVKQHSGSKLTLSGIYNGETTSADMYVWDEFNNNVQVEIVDQDGNLLYNKSEIASGGIIKDNADTPDLLDYSQDILAQFESDIADILANLAAGKTADGTDTTGISYDIDGITATEDGVAITLGENGAYTIKVDFLKAFEGETIYLVYTIIANVPATVTYVDGDNDNAVLVDPTKVGEEQDTGVNADGDDNPAKQGTYTFNDSELPPDYVVNVAAMQEQYGEAFQVTDNEDGSHSYTLTFDYDTKLATETAKGIDGIVDGVNYENFNIILTKQVPADTTVHIVDDDIAKGGEEFPDHTSATDPELAGTEGEEGTFTFDIPDNYEYVDTDLPEGATVETTKDENDRVTSVTITFAYKSDTSDDFTIHLKHASRVVNPDDPDAKDEDSEYYKNTHASVNENVSYVNEDADGQPAVDDYTNTLDFTRSVTVDAVTGKIIDDTAKWGAVTDDTFIGKDVDIPERVGYHPEITVNGESKDKITDMLADPDKGDYNIVITYVANDKVSVVGNVVDQDDIDGDDGKFPIILTIEDDSEGKTGSITYEIPDGYELDTVRQDSSGSYVVSEDGRTVTVTFEYQDSDKDNFTIYLNHKHHTIDPDDENNPDPTDPDSPNNPNNPYYEVTHDVHTEDVTYNGPDGEISHTTNNVEYHRTVEVDDVTGNVIEKSEGDWTLAPGTDNLLNGVTEDEINDVLKDYPGYHVEITVDGEVQSGTSVDSQKVLAEDGVNRTIVITIAPNTDTETDVTYYDNDSNVKVSGPKAVDEGGVTNTDGTYKYDIPDDYVLDEKAMQDAFGNRWNQKDGTVTFTYKEGDSDNFTIFLKHDTLVIGPDTDNPAWPDSSKAVDVTDDVTRTITYTDAEDSSKTLDETVTQTVSFGRTAVVDAVTGDVLGYDTDGDGVADAPVGDDQGWSVTSEADSWAAQESKDHSADGYKAPSIASVAATDVKAGDEDVTVNVTYAHDTYIIDPSDPNNPNNPDENDPNYTHVHDSVDENVTYQQNGQTYNNGEDDVTNTIEFGRSAEVDAVTGQIIEDSEGDWKVIPGKDTDGDGDNIFNGDTIKVDPPAGYHAVINGTPADEASDIAVNAGSPDQSIVIDYVADTDTPVNVTYVDNDSKDASGNPAVVSGPTLVANGTTDTDGTYTYDIPEGYVVDEEAMKAAFGDKWSEENGQVTYTFLADGAGDFTIFLKHDKKIIDPDNPDANEEGDKYYDATHSSIDETVSYTKNGEPYGDSTSNSVDYTRSIEVDAVTGEPIVDEEGNYVDATEWAAKDGDTSLDGVTPEAIPGYDMDITVNGEAVEGDKVDVLEVKPGDADRNIVINYVAGDTDVQITYHDNTDKKDLPETDSMTGTTDAEGKYTITVPKGYDIDTDAMNTAFGNNWSEADGTVTFTFLADETDNFTVYLKHHITPIDPNTPGYEDQTHTNVTQHIDYTTSDGTEAPADPEDQVIGFHRSGTYDEVTDTYTWDAWVADDSSQFKDVDSTPWPGYTPDFGTVAGSIVDPSMVTEADDQTITHTVVYSPDADTTATITYHDDETGEDIRVDTVTGTTNTDEDYTVNVPDGYVIDTDKSNYTDGQDLTITILGTDDDNIVIHLNHDTKIIDPDDPNNPDPTDPDSPNNPDNSYYDQIHDVHHEDITYVGPDGKEISTSTNDVEYHRTIEVDAITGEPIEGSESDWKLAPETDGNLNGVTSDEIADLLADYPGYHVEITVDGTKIDGTSVDALAVAAEDGQNRTIVVTVVPNDDTETHIHYVDNAGNEIWSPDAVVGTTDSEGHYTIDMSNDALKGWVIDTAANDYKDGQDITFTIAEGDGDDVTIVIKHGTHTIDPTDPDNPDNPDNPDDPNYVDTHQSVDETINYSKNGEPYGDSEHSTIEFGRSAEVDDVTGKIIEGSEGEWKVIPGKDTDGDGDNTFNGKTVTPPAGYHTVINGDATNQIPNVAVGPNDADVTINVEFVADSDTPLDITYHDNTDNKDLPEYTENLTGTTDTTENDHKINVPKGYVIDNEAMTNAYGEAFDAATGTIDVTFLADHAGDVTVFLQHGTTPVNPDNPNWPDDSKAVDLEKDVTRTIDYKDAETGTTVAESVTQEVSYERSAIVDTVTGEILGYDLDGDGVLDTKDGEAAWVMSEDSAAKLWDAVNSPDLSGEGYDAPSQTTVKQVEVDPSMDDQNVTVTYGHSTTPIDPDNPDWPDASKAVEVKDESTREIHYYDEVTGDEIAPMDSETVTYKRYAIVDNVTGDILGYDTNNDGEIDTTNGDEAWVTDDATWDKVDSPDLSGKGYDTPDKTSVGETTVKPGQDDETVNVYYGHATKPIDPTDPESPYFDDANKDITSDITYVYDKDGSKAADDHSQTVHYSRGGTFDAVTGEVISWDTWTAEGPFVDVDSPDVIGYHPDQATVYGDDLSQDQINSYVEGTPITHEVRYVAADDTTANVTYIDNDANGEVVKPDITDEGVTDEEGNYTISIPKGYIVDEAAMHNFYDTEDDMWSWNESDNTITFTYKGDDSDDFTIYLKHDEEVVDPDDHENPDDPMYNETHWTVDQTVHYVDQNGKTIRGDKDYHLNYERTITRDAVTHEVLGYGAWTLVGGDAADGVDNAFAEHDVPEIPGYYALPSEVPSQSIDISESVAGNPGDSQDQEFTVYYYPTDVTVDPSDPVDPDTPLSPVDPNSPVYPDGVQEDDLNTYVTETIHYVDQDGNELDDTYTRTVHYEREGHIHYNADGTADAPTYGDWKVAGDNFTEVVSPQIDGYFPDQANVPAPQIDMEHPDEAADIDVTVTYYPDELHVDPNHPLVPGTPIDPDNPLSPVIPDGVEGTDLNKTITETIHYVDQNGNPLPGVEDGHVDVNYSHGATIHWDQNGVATVVLDNDGAWIPAGDFNDITSPEVDGYFTLNKEAGYKDADDVTSDFEINVIYYPTSEDIDPSDPKDPDSPVNPKDPDSPDYPDDVDYDDLNKDVTETVHYVDENGKELAGSKEIEVHYTRTAHVEWDENGKATTTYGDWVAEKDFWDEQSPDIPGYFTMDKEAGAKDASTVSDDFDTYVTYYPSHETIDPKDPKDPDQPVNPNDPDSPVYPDGVDVDDLNKDVTEHIHYVDEDGNEVAGTYDQVVHYEREAYVEWDEDGVPHVTGYSDWKAVGDFEDVKSPSVDGYFTLNKNAGAKDGDSVTDDFDVYVTYYPNHETIDPKDPKNPDQPVNPEDPDSPDYPDGVDTDDLNKTITETVHYVDQNGKELAGSKEIEVHYSRTAEVTWDENGNASVTYGEWTPEGNFGDITSPTIPGYFTTDKEAGAKDASTVSDDFDTYVTYYPSDIDVDPKDPKDPDTPVNPEDPNSPEYPDGVDADDLNKDVTETIHFVDENGNELEDTYTQTVHYSREGHVHFNEDGSTTVTYDAWTAEGDFEAVDTPVIDGYVADFTQVKEYDGDDVTEDFDVTVIYHVSDVDVPATDPKDPNTPLDPNDPNSPVYPDGVTYDDLNKDITETIHYRDADTGAELADSFTQTVHYSRTGHVHFNADGTTTVTYSEWVADGDFDAVQSPVIDGYVADKSTVGAIDGSTVTDDMDLVVYYHRAEVETDDNNDDDVKSTPAHNNGHKAAAVGAKKLPQTGDKDDAVTSELGVLGLIAGSLGLFGLAKKRKRNGED